MSNSKRTSVRFQFPCTTLNFNHVVQPDMKYGPVYQTTPTFSAEEGKALIAKMEKLNPAFVGKIPFSEKDGQVSFKVKQKKYITWFDKKTGKKQEKEIIPVLLDKDNKELKLENNPWGGSTGEVGLTVDLTKDNNGNPVVALRLVGIRFHELKEGGESNSDPLFGGGKSGDPADIDDDDADDKPDYDKFDDDIPF